MPPPGVTPPDFSTPKATVAEYVKGVEVRRALDVDTGEPVPTAREELPFLWRLGSDLVVKLIKHWLPRQVLKVLTAIAAALGGDALANGDTNQAVTTWVVAAVLGLFDMALSWLARRRFQNKITQLQ